MFASQHCLSVALCVGVALADSASVVAQELPRALAIESEVQRIASGPSLWPGFEPLALPLAIFTGDSTFLFRHPAPPDGFVTIAGPGQRVDAYRGRHPAVTSNSSAEIG